MGMDCRSTAETAIQWKDSKGLSPETARDFRAHLDVCPSCRRSYSRLIPFLLRDSGIESPAAADALAFSSKMADALMARIGDKAPGKHRPLVHRFARAVPFMAATAAACLFLAVGLPMIRDAGMAEVRFTLVAPEASSVRLAADFSGWAEQGYEMTRSAEGGTWEITVKLRRGRSYRYNFVVDGKTWIPDPKADVLLDDGFGSQSSALTI